jgi:hypothetical protein
MSRTSPNFRWQTTVLKPRLPWNNQAIRPAEISSGLCSVMLARENLLEDADYLKIVPNQFVVELSQANYLRNYQPLGERLLEQWREKLVQHLLTANSRQGRQEYRFGGQLQIDIRPGAELKDSQARILSQVLPDIDPVYTSVSSGRADNQTAEAAHLEAIHGEQRWPLFPGDNTIGRDESCDICLFLPLIQEKRLISGQHAYIRCDRSGCTLFDGASNGKPSANGTYVNSQRVSERGRTLQDGDIILLAALDPDHPRPDTPGVAAFRFRKARAG